MFSYDFKANNNEWFPEEKNLLKRKRNRNALIFIQKQTVKKSLNLLLKLIK